MIKWSVFITSFFIVLLTNYACAQQEPEATPSSVGIDSVRNNRLLIYPGFGVGLVRNDFTPTFYINVGFNHKDRYEANLNTSSFFFFEREVDKNYKVFRNTFLNAEFLLNFSMLSRYEKNMNGLGIGYLIESKGQYFKETTLMFYYKRKFKYFSVLPGIMLADDLQDVFPVISIRL